MFPVDEPVQETGVFRRSPVVVFAVFDISFEIVERFHVHRCNTGDFSETFDFSRCQPNVVAESDHCLQRFPFADSAMTFPCGLCSLVLSILFRFLQIFRFIAKPFPCRSIDVNGSAALRVEIDHHAMLCNPSL